MWFKHKHKIGDDFYCVFWSVFIALQVEKENIKDMLL